MDKWAESSLGYLVITSDVTCYYLFPTVRNQVFSMMKTVRVFLKWTQSRVCFLIQIMELLCLRLVYIFIILLNRSLCATPAQGWLTFLLLTNQVDSSLRLPLKILDKSCQVFQVTLFSKLLLTFSLLWKKKRINSRLYLYWYPSTLLTNFPELHFQGGNVGHLHKLLSIESSSQVLHSVWMSTS